MNDWLEIAKRLRHGESQRIQCCGKNNDAVVSCKRGTYAYHCFKCDSSEYHRCGDRPLVDLEFLNEQATRPLTLKLPEDFTTEIPRQHKIWLYRASIDDATCLEQGIGWSDHLQRIVLPIYGNGNQLLYYQARAVHKGQIPKYLNPKVNKDSLLYWVGRNESKRRIVVTEDILSAIRVGKHTPACSILGTKTSDQQAGLLSEYTMVSYWLDPDKAGRKGSREGCRKLSLCTGTEILTSNKDPKNLPDRVLRQVLCLPDLEKYQYHGRITS